MAVKESDWLGLMADPHLGFTDVQEANIVGIVRSPETYEKDALGLAIEIGKALEAYTQGEFESNPDSLMAILVNIFRHLLRLADHARISLKKAAYLNLKKVSSRWPMEKKFPERFDAGLDEYERFPDQIQIDFIERNVGGKSYVFQKFFGLTIGDRLSDNRREPDGYSFHDVFHLSYAAILCWSPVLRALLKLKRKSKPEIDEAEDGARAIIIEEAIATWIFCRAREQNYFEGLSVLDYSILKAISQQIRGFEVDQCPLWLLERAILDGFSIFRLLLHHRSGRVIGDLTNRSLTFQSLT